ncbi:hypothetical protein B0T13DRAFT_444814 [Neurospora crassa]|nr:hypothetical protein B0T13DRAFT_444814 [Neurospora crassa]
MYNISREEIYNRTPVQYWILSSSNTRCILKRALDPPAKKCQAGNPPPEYYGDAYKNSSLLVLKKEVGKIINLNSIYILSTGTLIMIVFATNPNYPNVLIPKAKHHEIYIILNSLIIIIFKLTKLVIRIFVRYTKLIL